MDQKYYAHSKEGRPPSEWQPLEEHLRNVGEMASGFNEALGRVTVGCFNGIVA